MLLGPALQLPDPEANKHQNHRQRDDAESRNAAAPSRCRSHFGPRSMSRPGAAL